MTVFYLIPLALLVMLGAVLAWRLVNLEDRLDRLTGMEMGSLHWESEVLARLYEEDHPEIEWNRTDDGYITGIMHDAQVHMVSTGSMIAGSQMSREQLIEWLRSQGAIVIDERAEGVN